MSRLQRIGLVWIALLVCGAHGAASGEEFGLRSLEGLRTLRIEIASSLGIDPVEVEVIVFDRLAGVGIAMDPHAEAVLSVDAGASENQATAGAMLMQRVCLERDPLLTLRLPTWSVAEVERSADGEKPMEIAWRALDRVMQSFLSDWRTANP
jgi:hypothetical protein